MKCLENSQHTQDAPSLPNKAERRQQGYEVDDREWGKRIKNKRLRRLSAADIIVRYPTKNIIEKQDIDRDDVEAVEKGIRFLEHQRDNTRDCHKHDKDVVSFSQSVSRLRLPDDPVKLFS